MQFHVKSSKRKEIAEVHRCSWCDIIINCCTGTVWIQLVKVTWMHLCSTSSRYYMLLHHNDIELSLLYHQFVIKMQRSSKKRLSRAMPNPNSYSAALKFHDKRKIYLSWTSMLPELQQYSSMEFFASWHYWRHPLIQLLGWVWTIWILLHLILLPIPKPLV